MTLPDRPVPDLPSEYGRLLAERDRLIGDGVNPAELRIPYNPDPLHIELTDSERNTWRRAIHDYEQTPLGNYPLSGEQWVEVGRDEQDDSHLGAIIAIAAVLVVSVIVAWLLWSWR